MFNVDHYAISISNADESCNFYKKLGFKTIKDWTADDNSLRIIHMDNGGFVLEMFCYKKHEDLPKFVEFLGTDLQVLGSKHLGLHVDDLNKAADYLVNVGILNEKPVIVPGRLGRSYFFVKDPDGIFIEIIAAK